MAQSTLPYQTPSIEKDASPSFPFSMVEKMMPMFPRLAVMGWLVVFVAFLVGLFVMAPANSAFFADAKAVREGAEIGSAFVNANVTRHVVEAWVPSFKFLGLGMLLMAIVMALGTIAKRLRHMGKVITNNIPQQYRPAMPPIPKTVRLFQMSTMMGLMVLLTAFIIGVILAAGVVPAYWNHGIISTLNGAEPGSNLLNQLGIVGSFGKWLSPLRMVGMSLLFTGITIALTVIINTLRLQAKLLIDFYENYSEQLS